MVNRFDYFFSQRLDSLNVLRRRFEVKNMLKTWCEERIEDWSGDWESEDGGRNI